MMKKALAVLLSSVTVLTSTVTVGATGVDAYTPSPEVQETTTEVQETLPEYDGEHPFNVKKLKLNKKQKVGGQKATKYAYDSGVELWYSFKVNNLSDVEIEFDPNKYVYDDIAYYELHTKNKDLLYGSGESFYHDITDDEHYEYHSIQGHVLDIRNDKIDGSYSTYTMKYKSLPKGTYYILLKLKGKKNLAGTNKLGGSIKVSTKKAYVGQVNARAEHLGDNKYKITWKNAINAKKYECQVVSGFKSDKMKVVSSSTNSMIVEVKKAYYKQGAADFRITPINGKHRGVTTNVVLFDYNE